MTSLEKRLVLLSHITGVILQDLANMVGGPTISNISIMNLVYNWLNSRILRKSKLEHVFRAAHPPPLKVQVPLYTTGPPLH